MKNIHNSYTRVKNYHNNNHKYIGRKMYYRGQQVIIKSYDSSCFCWIAHYINDGIDVIISCTQSLKLNY